MKLKHFIWKYVQIHRTRFLLVLFFSLFWTVDTLFWPYFLRNLIEVLTKFDLHRTLCWPELKIVLLFGAGAMILIETGFRLRDFIQAKLFPLIESKIRMDLFDHVQHHSPKYFNEHFSGTLSNKIGDMVLANTSILRNVLNAFIPATFSCILTIVLFATINHYLALIVAIWIVGHLLLSWKLTIACEEYSKIHGEARSKLMGKILDSLTNNFAVNLFFRFKHEKELIHRYQDEELKTNYKAEVYSAKMFTVLTFGYLFQFFSLIGAMSYFWTKGFISTGEVIQLFYTMWNLSLIIWLICSWAPEFFRSLGLAKQAISLMNDPVDLFDSETGVELQATKGEIIFQDVSFSYGKKKIFSNQNIKISAGEKVGLVGYSGAGKSTFINLILRFFQLEKGKILIDGQDISTVTLESVRKTIALIPQDPILFHRTLEENIRYGRLDASFDEVVQAAKLAHCHEFIERSVDGYLTLVGERGTKLSGGEKQRIAIARAMLVKAPILILDEATSALDSVTEEFIQDSLSKLMKNRTTIVIAHRLSTLAKMDRILVFNQGEIVEEGTHYTLLEKNGHYAKMWKMQAGGFLPETPT
jgi:ATP-binding cassette subfamily B protein